MRRFPGLRRVFRLSGMSRTAERDVAEELEFHFAMRVADLVARGRTPDEARAEAERRFGDVRRYRGELTAIERGRAADARRADRLEAVVQDMRHTLRGLAARPGFALTVVATFALGIGANATMFGVVDRLLLRPPPHVAAPERLVELAYAYDWRNQRIRNDSYPWIALEAIAGSTPALERVAAWAQWEMNLGRGSEARPIRVVQASGDYFSTLGVRPIAGRLLTAHDDAAPAGQPVAVVSEGFWRRELGERLGVTIELDRAPYTVVGVVPADFHGLDIRPIEAWVPIAAVRAASNLDPEWRTSPGWQWLSLVGRLRDGATHAEAAVQTAVPLERTLRAPDDPPYERFEIMARSPLPIETMRDAGEARVALLLAGVSLLVLLIASANVANQLLARALQRRREIAVRLALGAGRGRVAWQLVLDGLVLAVAGGAAALLVVRWSSEFVQRMLLGTDVALSTSMDGRVLLFTAAATVMSGVSGVVPAIQASRPSLSGALRLGPRGAGSMPARTRTILLITQAALSVVLLVGTGLFVRSLHSVGQTRLGMDVHDVIVGAMRLRTLGYDSPRIDALFNTLAEQAAALPGVEQAATAAGLPLSTSYVVRFRIPGRDTLPAPPGGGPYLNAVSPTFLQTLGTRLRRGRAFTSSDHGDGARVMLVTERMVHFYWPDRDPIGQCVQLVADSLPCTTVIGVIENLHRQRIAEPPAVQYLVPLSQAPAFLSRQGVLFVRPAPGADRTIVAAAVRRLMQGAAPDLPHAKVFMMSELLEGEMRPWRLGAVMFGAFGVLALLLAAVGMYGVVSYAVAQRTHEMGVRMALGARAADVVRLVLRQGVAVVLVGVAIGLALAAAAAPLAGALLFRTSSRDPAVYAGVTLILVAVACLAALLPAWRASRVDPAVALRVE